MKRCVASANASNGVHVTASSFLSAEEVTTSSNGGRGLQVQFGSLGFCTGCTFSGNTRFAVGAANGAIVSALDSVTTGARGLVATLNSYADIETIETIDEMKRLATRVVAR